MRREAEGDEEGRCKEDESGTHEEASKRGWGTCEVLHEERGREKRTRKETGVVYKKRW
jgi:hypothetical protein